MLRKATWFVGSVRQEDTRDASAPANPTVLEDIEGALRRDLGEGAHVRLAEGSGHVSPSTTERLLTASLELASIVASPVKNGIYKCKCLIDGDHSPCDRRGIEYCNDLVKELSCTRDTYAETQVTVFALLRFAYFPYLETWISVGIF